MMIVTVKKCSIDKRTYSMIAVIASTCHVHDVLSKGGCYVRHDRAQTYRQRLILPSRDILSFIS